MARHPACIVPPGGQLLAAECRDALPKLEHVALTRGQVIYRADRHIEQVHFPEEAVVAIVHIMDNRRTVEVGIIGREGVVGINSRDLALRRGFSLDREALARQQHRAAIAA